MEVVKSEHQATLRFWLCSSSGSYCWLLRRTYLKKKQYSLICILFYVHAILQYNLQYFQKPFLLSWLVWLSGLSVGCKPKDCWFKSQSGHMPGLQARSPVGATWAATTHWCVSPSFSSSLPLSLKRNKENLLKNLKKIIFVLWDLKHV